jgi:hypothetical protein
MNRGAGCVFAAHVFANSFIRGAGNSIIIADNLTDLSSPAMFADKAMKGLTAKQVKLFQHAVCRLAFNFRKQLGLLHDANGLAGAGSNSMMIGTQLK